jgi:hypothetical protein
MSHVVLQCSTTCPTPCPSRSRVSHSETTAMQVRESTPMRISTERSMLGEV